MHDERGQQPVFRSERGKSLVPILGRDACISFCTHFALCEVDSSRFVPGVQLRLLAGGNVADVTFLRAAANAFESNVLIRDS